MFVEILCRFSFKMKILEWCRFSVQKRFTFQYQGKHTWCGSVVEEFVMVVDIDDDLINMLITNGVVQSKQYDVWKSVLENKLSRHDVVTNDEFVRTWCSDKLRGDLIYCTESVISELPKKLWQWGCRRHLKCHIRVLWTERHNNFTWPKCHIH